jgi:hypothetical protein
MRLRLKPSGCQQAKPTEGADTSVHDLTASLVDLPSFTSSRAVLTPGGARRILQFLLLLALLAFFAPLQLNVLAAQEPNAALTWQVFLQRDVDEAGADRLTFIDVLTGDDSTVDVTGERYTLAGDRVIYFDRAEERVMVAYPDGSVRRHPFIQPAAETRRIDWLVAPDHKHIVWTLTDGSPDSLTTVTTFANLDGTSPRQVMVDGPRNSIRALPVAFSPDMSTLYMDFQPDGVSDFTPFPQFAGLFALDLETGTQAYLPDEPGCFCGAGFGDGLFLRLAVSRDLSGFDLKVYNLVGEVEETLPAIALTDYTQAGDIVISPDGSKAVYAVAQIRDFGTPNQSVRTVFVLVDINSMSQAALTEPITTFVEPLAWTEDNSAVIFTSRQRDGTWKISLSDGRLTKVAEATYLGVLG